MNYAIHILTIKKWEWEAAKDRWDREIAKHGLFEEGCKYYNIAVERIEEIDEAIKLLTKATTNDR